jgi:hypothetical protein
MDVNHPEPTAPARRDGDDDSARILTFGPWRPFGTREPGAPDRDRDRDRDDASAERRRIRTAPVPAGPSEPDAAA